MHKVQTGLIKMLQSRGSVKQSIRKVVEQMAYGRRRNINGRYSRTVDGKRGCLVCDTTMEMSSRGNELGELIHGALQRIEKEFERAVCRGQENGEISTERTSKQVARYLVSSIQGMAVIAKTAPSRAHMRDIVDTTLSVLD